MGRYNIKKIDYCNYFWQDDKIRLRAIQAEDWEGDYISKFDSPARRLLECSTELPPVYKCTLANGSIVYLKIPFSKLKYQRELEAYEILLGKVRIPEMLDYWPGNEEFHGAFLLSELKGTPLTNKAKAATSVAYQVGVLQAEMHSISPPAKQVLTGIKNEFPNWSDFVERQFYSFAEDVKDILDEPLFIKAIEKYEKMKKQLPPSDGPSFVHMDFRPANILVDQEKVSGVIDFESVRFGSTEIDFTKVYREDRKSVV